MLRKDFILDPYQVLEARAAGADAVLLIAECLDDATLQTLHDAIVALGMTPLVELYEPENLPRVLAVGARLIGVNNRDLRTFDDRPGAHDPPAAARFRPIASWSAKAASALAPTSSVSKRPASTPCWSARP